MGKIFFVYFTFLERINEIFAFFSFFCEKIIFVILLGHGKNKCSSSKLSLTIR